VTYSLNQIHGFIAIRQLTLCFVLYQWDSSIIRKLPEWYESWPLLNGFFLDVKVWYETWWIFHGFSGFSMLFFKFALVRINFRCATSSWDRNLLHMVSHWWHTWMCLQRQAVSPSGLVPWKLLGLGAPAVEYSESLWEVGIQNYVSAMDSIPVPHLQSGEICSVLYSPTPQWYSPPKMDTGNPITSFSVSCLHIIAAAPGVKVMSRSISSPTSASRLSGSKTNLLTINHLVQIDGQETWFQASQESNVCGLEHSHVLIGKSNLHSAAWASHQDTCIEIHCWFCWVQRSIPN